LRIYESKWRSYWNEMKRYRDQSVAHHDIRSFEIKNYPRFDLALEAAYFYYEFIVDELRKMGIQQQPSDLREYSEAYCDCSDEGDGNVQGKGVLKHYGRCGSFTRSEVPIGFRLPSPIVAGASFAPLCRQLVLASPSLGRGLGALFTSSSSSIHRSPTLSAHQTEIDRTVERF
jgi:hypothetical protein